MRLRCEVLVGSATMLTYRAGPSRSALCSRRAVRRVRRSARWRSIAVCAQHAAEYARDRESVLQRAPAVRLPGGS